MKSVACSLLHPGWKDPQCVDLYQQSTQNGCY